MAQGMHHRILQEVASCVLTPHTNGPSPHSPPTLNHTLPTRHLPSLHYAMPSCRCVLPRMYICGCMQVNKLASPQARKPAHALSSVNITHVTSHRPCPNPAAAPATATQEIGDACDATQGRDCALLGDPTASAATSPPLCTRSLSAFASLATSVDGTRGRIRS